MIIEADTKAEVEDVIKSDIYYKEGVWNASKVCIWKSTWPFNWVYWYKEAMLTVMDG